MNIDRSQNQKSELIQKKILLVLLPFWNPLTPPLGISCLKTYLQQKGFNVKAVDVNIEVEFRKAYSDYFRILSEGLPRNKQGCVYYIGNEVLRNHLMAHINREDEDEYLQLVRVIINRTFYEDIEKCQVFKLNELINEFYNRLNDYFLDLLNKEKPGILGLSVYSDTLPASLFIFKLTREKYPHIKTVMGGGVFADQLAIGSPNMETFLQKTKEYIDKIIIGEGEILFSKFLQGELPGSQRVYQLADLKGEVLDISSQPITDFSDFNIPKYPLMASYSSRSCPHRCRFCSETTQWGKYRSKSPGILVDQLVELYKKYNKQLFLFGDSLLNPGIDRLAKELLKREAVIYWDGYLRAEKPVGNPDNTLLWRRAGFYRARLGLESGSRRLLESMHKNITVEQIKASVSSLAQVGIKTCTLWIAGYPGETEEDFQETMEIIEELKDDIYEAWCSPFEYYISGQGGSTEWSKRKTLLYPRKAKNMLITQTWILTGDPSREKTYNRVVKLKEHLIRLGIPTPNSLNEIYKADERWKKLHEDAVPSIVEFNNNENYIDECKNVAERFYLPAIQIDNDDFGF
jgi:radical SAM superfamily enzyme YgiQ (UPF0313 family)